MLINICMLCVFAALTAMHRGKMPLVQTRVDQRTVCLHQRITLDALDG